MDEQINKAWQASLLLQKDETNSAAWYRTDGP